MTSTALDIVAAAVAHHDPTSTVEARQPMSERLLSLTGLALLPPNRSLIDGLIYANTLCQLSGPPGSYKTMAIVGAGCSLALGLDWEGHRVREPGVVVLVAAEGANGLATRIFAWCEKSNVDPAQLEGRLFVLPEPMQLGSYIDVSEAVDACREVGAKLLILDTRARCTLGLSENDATEQGTAIGAADRIRQAAGCAVLLVHHSGRNGDHGRGSNAWDGAVWSDLRLKGEEQRAVIHCEKHKDAPDGCDHHFRLVPHTVSETLLPRLDGEDDCAWLQRRSTLVIVQNGAWTTEYDDRRSTRVVLDIVRTTAGEEGLTRAQIAVLAREQNLSRASAYAAVATLADQRKLRTVGTNKPPRYAALRGT